MFRGGPVSSYGKGIAAPLVPGYEGGGQIGGGIIYGKPMADGRYGFALPAKQNLFDVKEAIGEIKVGGELSHLHAPNFQPIPTADEVAVDETVKINEVDTEPKDFEGEVGVNTTDEYVLKQIGRDPIPKLVKNENYEPPTRTITGQKRGRIFEREVELNEAELAERAEADIRAQGYLPDSGPAPMKGITQINNTPVDVNPETGNVETINNTTNEESTAISADDIRAQAALFDELLNEGYEKDKRSAQISDASDYALQFFKSTVGEGKGMKEAAGDVAGYALAKPSKTEAVKAGQKKTKQTATVMAINDYLAGEKSERELKKILALADHKGNINLANQIELIELKRGKIGERISEAVTKSPMQTVTVGIIENILKPEGKEITKIPADQTGKWKPDKKDEGNYIIEEETKNVFQIINGVPVKLY